jgi:hypothetical protein
MLDDIFDRLAAPFPPDSISWRVGNTNINRQTGNPPDGKPAQGLALAYLDARDVMDRLDLVCGPAGWQCRYSHAEAKTVCEISIRVDGEWITKADGAGDSGIEATKGALSDAFKRAAVRWGIGRYLYGLPSPWVELSSRGRSWVIKDSEYAKLRKLLSSFTGVTPKTSAQAARDKDFEYFKAQIEAATDEESLGAVGREIKQQMPLLPAAHRDPLHDAYALRLEAIRNAKIIGDQQNIASFPADWPAKEADK